MPKPVRRSFRHRRVQKLRFGGRGKGKRGGYRAVGTFYSGEIMPVFLITVFAKGEKSTLTAKEKAGLKNLTKLLAAKYSKKISSLEKRKGWRAESRV